MFCRQFVLCTLYGVIVEGIITNADLLLNFDLVVTHIVTLNKPLAHFKEFSKFLTIAQNYLIIQSLLWRVV